MHEHIKNSIHCPTEPMAGYLKAAMLISRQAFDQVGLFSTQYKAGDFIDWYMRAKEIGLKSVMLPDVVLKRRLHSTNTPFREQKKKKANQQTQQIPEGYYPERGTLLNFLMWQTILTHYALALFFSFGTTLRRSFGER